jgi:hypothetical protein
VAKRLLEAKTGSSVGPRPTDPNRTVPESQLVKNGLPFPIGKREEPQTFASPGQGGLLRTSERSLSTPSQDPLEYHDIT